MPVLESKFSTEDLPPELRHTVWRDVISTVFDVTPGGLGDVEEPSVLNSYCYGDVILSYCHSHAQNFARSSKRLSTDPVDHMLLQLYVEGGCEARSGAKELSIKPGDMFVVDLAEECSSVNGSSFDILSYVIPRRLLAEHLVRPDSQNGCVIDPENPLTKVISDQMKSLYRIGTGLQDAALPRLNTALVSMVAAAINASDSNADADHVNQSYRLAAVTVVKDAIERHLPDESLDVEQLAAISGVSRSQLYRMFKAFGGVYVYLKARRLKRAVKLLCDDNSAGLKVYQVAYACGFKSEAHFCRAFKEAFAMTPKEMRNVKDTFQVFPQRPANVEHADFDTMTWVENLG